MLQLAQQCRQLQAYVHVSTAYVNCNLPSGTRIMEELPIVSYDGDDLLEEIARLPTEAIVARTPGWLGKYPNTYTFTKALGERLLHKHRGQVTLPHTPQPQPCRQTIPRRRGSGRGGVDRGASRWVSRAGQLVALHTGRLGLPWRGVAIR
jgi:hypothetical protein